MKNIIPTIVIILSLITIVWKLSGQLELCEKRLKEAKVKLNHLELKLEDCKCYRRWEGILEQLLPPQARAELDLLTETLKQRKE